MTEIKTTSERVLALIESYGANPLAWPEVEREAALAIIDADPARFATALEDAEALDTAFEELEPVEPPIGLVDRILEAAPQPKHSGSPGGFWGLILPGGRRWPAAVTALSMAFGIGGGMAVASTLDDDDADIAIARALDGGYAFDWETVE